MRNQGRARSAGRQRSKAKGRKRSKRSRKSKRRKRKKKRKRPRGAVSPDEHPSSANDSELDIASMGDLSDVPQLTQEKARKRRRPKVPDIEQVLMPGSATPRFGEPEASVTQDLTAKIFPGDTVKLGGRPFTVKSMSLRKLTLEENYNGPFHNKAVTLHKVMDEPAKKREAMHRARVERLLELRTMPLQCDDFVSALVCVCVCASGGTI